MAESKTPTYQCHIRTVQHEDDIKLHLGQQINKDLCFSPVILQLLEKQKPALYKYCEENHIETIDQINNQVSELRDSFEKCPANKDLEGLTLPGEEGLEDGTYGLWVYYPWKKAVARIVPRTEFNFLKTWRNQEKITSEEQKRLEKKSLGVVGLSLGATIAKTLCQESLCSKLIISDPDTLSLSNINRLDSSSILNINVNKSIILARTILENDPFLTVQILLKGIDSNNVDLFKSVDVLVDECDDIRTKLVLRHFAKRYKIPIVMGADEEGMLFIEDHKNFELPLFLGFDGTETLEDVNFEELDHIEKILKLLPIVGGLEALSERGVKSLENIKNHKLCGFPQLCEETHLCTAYVVSAVRHFLLDQPIRSGKYNIVLDKIFSGQPTLLPKST